MDKKLENLKEHLGRNVRSRRAYLKMSQEELALKADMGRKHVSMIEGAQANPTIQILSQLAAALDTTVSELLAVPEVKRR